MLNSLSDKNMRYMVFFYTFVYLILHYQAHMYVTGGLLPPHSDSLSYQYYALDTLHSISTNTFSISIFLFGDDIDHIPPLYKIIMLLSYMIGGLNSGSEYIINYLIVLIGGYYLSKISFLLYKDKRTQYLTFLFYISLHGVVEFSFYDTRNDTLSIALFIISIYYLFKSDFFYNLKYSLIVAFLISLALLTKSAFGGYIILPFAFLLFVIYTTDDCKTRYKNLFLSTFSIVLLTGWYYFTKYDAIIDYYSFWSSELSSVVFQQYNINSLYDKALFYPKNLLNNFGFTGYFFIALGGYYTFCLMLRKCEKFKINKQMIFIISLIFLPYIMLYSSGSYSVVADLYMVPFVLIVLMSFFKPYSHRFIFTAIFVFVGLLGSYDVINHYSLPTQNKMNHKSFAYKLNDTLNNYQLSNKAFSTLFYDLDLNSKTIFYTNMKEPYLRSKANLRVAEQNYKARVDPNLTPLAIYNGIKSKSDLMLIPNQSKGPQWININKQWAQLYALIKNDTEMLKIDEIDAYYDGTKVEVYLKNRVDYMLSSDGWLLSQSKLNIVAKPNSYLLRIINMNNFSNIDSLVLKDSNDKIYKLKKELINNKYQYMCDINITEIKSQFLIYSDNPLVPSKISDSQDKRSLLLNKPSISIARSF